MKKFVLIISLSFLATTVFSQFRIGIRLGPSFVNFVGSDVKQWGGANVDPTAQIKFHLGGYFEYFLTENISIQPGLYYSAKGPKYDGEIESYSDGPGTSESMPITYKKRLSYIDIPILFHYHLNQQFSVFIGPQFAILVSAKVKNEASQQVLDMLGLQEVENAKDSYRGIDLDLPIGVAYELASGFNIQLGYEIGLINIAKGYSYDGGDGGNQYYNVKNSVIKLSFGYVIKDQRKN